MGKYDEAIAELKGRIQNFEVEIDKLKAAINALCQADGSATMYDESHREESVPVLASIRPDQFYGQPLATAVRSVLEMRKRAGLGPASVEEIYGTMKRGGYGFEAKSEDSAKNGLRISMSKTRRVFHKLPNDLWGLTDWYPGARQAKPTSEKTEVCAATPTGAGDKDKVDEGKEEKL